MIKSKKNPNLATVNTTRKPYDFDTLLNVKKAREEGGAQEAGKPQAEDAASANAAVTEKNAEKGDTNKK